LYSTEFGPRIEQAIQKFNLLASSMPKSGS